MKVNDLRNLIKESLKEVIKEELLDFKFEIRRELKEILEEKLKTQNSLTENLSSPNSNNLLSNEIDPLERKKLYESVLFETGKDMFGLNERKKFQPISVDPINGVLPEGDIDLSQITQLLGKG